MTPTLLNHICNRLAHGTCNSGDCLIRGGYKRGDVVNYETATCEAFEISRAIKILRQIIASADEPDSRNGVDENYVIVHARLIEEARELMK